METNSILTFENIILISTGLVNLILFIVIGLRNNKSRNTYLFLGFILSVFGWVSGVFLFRIFDGYRLLLATQFVYFSATLIPLFIFLFTETFPKRKLDFSKQKLAIFLAFPTLFCALSFVPGAIIDYITQTGDSRSIVFGPFYPFYVIYILTYFAIGIGLMVKRFFILKGLERNQIEIIFVSILVSSFVGVATNLILPSLGNFSLFWVGPFFSGYMVLTISYAIVKYGLFDMKLVAAEFVALSTWVLMFIKIISGKTRIDRTIDSAVLVLLVASGIFIIRAIIKERTLREKDDMLVDNVSRLNKSLEKTNLKLKELDEKKSEFMSLATHQLRAPLTAMRGYSSMILDGTFGKVNNPEIEDAIDKIARSTTDLTMIVEDYLNISRIEQGRMQYNFSVFDVTDTIKNIIKEVQVNIDRAGLTIALHYDENMTFRVNADEGKIKQVLFNLIDNASKYTKKGGIDIYVRQTEGEKVQIEIKDTGVGIKPEVLPTLFNKFVRAPDASQANILGTGLGLYVANQIIKAHNGRAWAESAGEGKGSSFFVELGQVK